MPDPEVLPSDFVKAVPAGLIRPGTIKNLFDRKELVRPGGSVGTAYTKSFNFNNREVLLPTILDGKQLTDDQAVKRFLSTGQHFGVFATPEHANVYANALHEAQAKTGFHVPEIPLTIREGVSKIPEVKY